MACACGMGFGMWGGMLIPGLFLVALIIGGVIVARRLWSGGRDGEPRSAMSVLERRFARGEIDEEEFVSRRDRLLTAKR